MEEREQKRARVGREEWAKRVERWRDSGLTTAEFAAELGISSKSLTYWAWALKREAGGEKRQWPSKRRAAALRTAPAVPAFVQVTPSAPVGRFELEVRGGRRLHIPGGFDAEQLRALLAILESA